MSTVPLGRGCLPRAAGLARLHSLIAAHAGPDQVLVWIEADRGLWVARLVAAGYRVFAINPRQTARFRERHTSSGAKSHTADAHALADMVLLGSRTWPWCLTSGFKLPPRTR